MKIITLYPDGEIEEPGRGSSEFPRGLFSRANAVPTARHTLGAARLKDDDRHGYHRPVLLFKE